MSRQPLLEVADLAIGWRDDRQVRPVVSDVAFSLEPGDTLGLVGESGSGKTVLARALLGIVDPPLVQERGSIRFEGRELVGLGEGEWRRIRGCDIALTTPEPRKHLNPLMTVGAQLANVVRAHRDVSRAAAIDEAIDLLTAVGIPDPARRLTAYPHELSGGMCQRVIISMALAHRTKLLVVDEPTAGLDVTISRQILDRMHDLVRQHGTALILVSRDLGVVAHYCHRVAVMYAGRIVETGSVEAFFDGPLHPYSRRLLASATAARNRSRGAVGATAMVPPAAEGCAYAPRCELALPSCRASVPVITARADGRSVRCLRADEPAPEAMDA